MAQFEIVCVPNAGAATPSGVEWGPTALAERVFASRLAPYVQDTCRSVEPCASDGSDDLAEAAALARSTRDEVATVLRARRIPIVIGDERSLVLGTLGAISAARERPFALVSFGARPGLRVDPTEPISERALALALGRGDPDLCALVHPSLETHNVALLGPRVVSPDEARWLREEAIWLYSSEELSAASSAIDIGERTMMMLEANGVRDLFLHVDLEVLDPAVGPGVRQPAPGGLDGDRLLKLVSYFSTTRFENLGLALSEYDPTRDRASTTLELAYGVIETFVRHSSHLYVR